MGSSSSGSSGGKSSSSSPTYGKDSKGNYKIGTDGKKVYQTTQNAQYFPDNYGGSAGWSYSSPSTGNITTGNSTLDLLTGGIATGFLSGTGNYGQIPTPQPQIPQPQMYDPMDYINELKEAQRASRIASLDKARESALSSLDTEKANVAPTYYDKRNQAAAASDVGAMNFAQYMAARGIKGPAGAMPEIYRQAGLQGQIGALDRQEAGEMSAIERQRSNVESGYASDVAAAEADVEAQAMQAAINQINADRAYQLQQAALDLNQQQFDWSKSPSNPAYQASIAAAKAAELDNVAREIENSYLPDTLKYQAERLAQQVKAGSLDYDTALAQLNQIKAQTSVYQRQANEPYSSGSGGSGNTTASITQNTNDFIANMGSNPVEAALYIQKNLPNTGGMVDVAKVYAQFKARFGEDAMKYLQTMYWTNQEE